MQTRWRLSAALLIIICGLFGFLMLTNKTPEPVPAKRLTDITTLDRIIIMAPDKQAIAFQRQNQQWHMLRPYAIAADVSRLAAVLTLPDAIIHRQLSTPILPEFKLNPPLLTVMLNNMRVLFGATDALNGYRYVLYKGQISLISDRLLQLQAPAEFFISRQLFPMQTAIHKITANFVTDGKQIEQGLDAAVWANATAVVVRKMQDITVQGHILATLDSDLPLRFDILSIKPLILARTDLGIQYHLDSDLQADLLPTMTQ